jgi:hypothetical protein
MMHLIAERMGGGYLSVVSSFSVITYTRNSPFISLKLEAQRYLTHIECGYIGSEVHSKNMNLLNSLNILSSKYQETKNKSDESLHFLNGIKSHKQDINWTEQKYNWTKSYGLYCGCKM